MARYVSVQRPATGKWQIMAEATEGNARKTA